MSRVSSSSTFNSSWSNCSADSDSGNISKLRRLKIQEGILLQNINKIICKTSENGEASITFCPELKSFDSDLRNSFIEIKNLFDSLKCNTTSKEALDHCDLEDIKTDVLQLEDKIKKFKNVLSLKQISLKTEEKEIMDQLNVSTEEEVKIIKHSRIKAKPFSDIVPSPVKSIINCPFKCKEVQALQDFLKSYHRHGGWNEYSHNVFTQTWNKYFGISATDSNRDIDLSDKKSIGFFNEIKEKIPGVDVEDIIQHSQWYLEYLHLKKSQQEALDKWRAKNKIIKQSQSKNKGNNLNDKKNKSIDLNGKTSKPNARRVNFIVSDGMKIMEEIYSVDSLEETSNASYASDNSGFSEFNPDLDKPKMWEHHINNDSEKNTTRDQKLNLRIEKKRGPFHFAKSTQQWNNMCNDRKLPNDNIAEFVPQIENIEKLCVPKWRLSVEKL